MSGVRASLPVLEKKKRMFKKIGNFCKESYNELVHKVSWPTMSELRSSAGVVLIASLLIALLVFAMDQVLQWGMELIYSLH